MTMRRALLVLLAVGLAMAAGPYVVVAAWAHRAESDRGGRIAAEGGFSVIRDGYRFANYGYSPGRPNLGSDELRQLFGDGVCAGFDGGQCVLSPPALAWMQQENAAMSDGHCVGFSVTALLFWAHLTDPAQFGASTVPALKISGNQLLAREIAYGYVFQTLPSVIGGEISSSPAAVVSALVHGLRRNGPLYTLGMINSGGAGGHAVTPYGVDRLGRDQYAILVYDNNFPDRPRKVLVNTKADTWRYVAAPNPGVPGSVYTGSASTRSLLLLPTRPGLGVQPCPFCTPQQPYALAARVGGLGARPASNAAAGLETIRLQSVGGVPPHLLVSNARGQRVGFVAGRLVDSIPGSRVGRVFVGTRTWQDHVEPEYEVPTGEQYRIAVTTAGGRGRGRSVATVTVLEPGFVAAAQGIVIAPGQGVSLTLNAAGTSLSFVRARGAREPVLVVGDARTGARDYRWSAADTARSTGRPVSVSLNATKQTMSVTGAGHYDLTMDAVQNSVGVFAHSGVAIASSATGVLSYGSWEDGQAVPLTLLDQHGAVTGTESLTDQPSSDTGSEFIPVEPTPAPAEPQPLAVAPGATSTALTCSPGTVVSGQPVTCTVEVGALDSLAPSIPAGDVQFFSDHAASFAPTCTLSRGACRITYTPTGVVSGSIDLTARYLADDPCTPGLSARQSEDTIVLQAGTASASTALDQGEERTRSAAGCSVS
jgi:hypothetical protein